MNHTLLILSEDAIFSRMLELELRLHKRSAHAVERVEESVSASVVMVDLDTSVIPTVGRDSRIIGFTREAAVSSADPDRRCSLILRRPFEVRRLVEEIEQLLEHRATGGGALSSLAVLDGRLVLGEASVPLSPKECAVMECLLSLRGGVVSRKSLATLLGDSNANKPEVYICHLRRKLEQLTHTVTVRTVRGVGYALIER